MNYSLSFYIPAGSTPPIRLELDKAIVGKTLKKFRITKAFDNTNQGGSVNILLLNIGINTTSAIYDPTVGYQKNILTIIPNWLNQFSPMKYAWNYCENQIMPNELSIFYNFPVNPPFTMFPQIVANSYVLIEIEFVFV